MGGEGCDKLDRINSPEPLLLRGKDLQDGIKIVACGEWLSGRVAEWRVAESRVAKSLVKN